MVQVRSGVRRQCRWCRAGNVVCSLLPVNACTRFVIYSGNVVNVVPGTVNVT